MIRIGVLDEEELYVGKLAAYLNRRNKGELQCCAFTQKDKLLAGIQEHRWDVVLTTDEKLIEGVQKERDDVCCIWLTEQERQSGERIYCIYRYQSGACVAEELNRILDRQRLRTPRDRRIVAVYSPVGRCGKTTMLLDYVRKHPKQQWLYIGMEDYGAATGETNDTLLYYTKERKKDKLLEQIEICDGVLASPYSPFDSKTIDREDMIWLFDILKQQTRYSGIFFDVGTGVLQEPEVLTVFDMVIVPYIEEELSLKKKERFYELVRAYGMEDWLDRIHFLDMRDADTLATLVE